jgi:hypothetical protein
MSTEKPKKTEINEIKSPKIAIINYDIIVISEIIDFVCHNISSGAVIGKRVPQM